MTSPDREMTPEAEEMMSRPDAERIAYIRTDRWIDYETAEKCLERMEWLLAEPKGNVRPPGMLLVGPPGNGKTKLTKAFMSDHRPIYADGGIVAPVLWVEMPSAADPKRFHMAILTELNAPGLAGDSLEKKESQSFLFLRKAGVKMLIVDEVHNMLSGAVDKRNEMLNLLRGISNRFGISIVAAGTKPALYAVQADAQLASRLQPYPLPRWTDGKQLKRLLASFESDLPLKLPSRLADDKIAGGIVARSEGLLCDITRLLTGAAEIAVRKGTERIEPWMFDQVPSAPLSANREVGMMVGLD